MDGRIGSTEGFLRQLNISRIVFDQQNFYGRSAPSNDFHHFSKLPAAPYSRDRTVFPLRLARYTAIVSFGDFPADRFRLQFLHHASKLARDALSGSRLCEIHRRIHALSAPLCRAIHRQITGDNVYLIGPKGSVLMGLQAVFITGKNLRAMARFRALRFQEQMLKNVGDFLAVPLQSIACTGCGHAAMGNCARNE